MTVYQHFSNAKICKNGEILNVFYYILVISK